MQWTSVRVDRETHDELKRQSESMGITVGQTVRVALRALRQDRIGAELARPLTFQETDWLDAELG